jgi:hypothetical protein
VKLLALNLEFGRPVTRRWPGYALLAIALLAAIAVGSLKSSMDSRLERYREELRGLAQSAHSESKRRVQNDPQLQSQLARANGVLDALTLPWEGMFTMVEGAGTGGLGLLSIVPDPAKRELRISGQAKTLDDVLAYVGRLAAQPLFADVHLVSYATVQHDGLPAIEFSIAARWTNS